MEPWVVWVIAGLVLAGGEVLTTGFFLAPFAVGALAASILAAVGTGAVVPWAVFIVLSVVLLAFVRPIARAHIRTPPQLRTGTAALVGRDALVVAPIEGLENVGQVKIDGEVWTARAYDGQAIPAGEKVQVVEIRGATALVTP